MVNNDPEDDDENIELENGTDDREQNDRWVEQQAELQLSNDQQ